MNRLKHVNNLYPLGVLQEKSSVTGVNLVENYNKSTNILNVFNIKLKKDDILNAKVEISKNFAGKPKHYPPANKE